MDRGKFQVEPKSIGQDWLNCVRSRKLPICDVEIGCRSVTVCHLGNLAYWNHRRLRWDPKKEKSIGDKEANTWLDRAETRALENLERPRGLPETPLAGVVSNIQHSTLKVER